MRDMPLLIYTFCVSFVNLSSETKGAMKTFINRDTRITGCNTGKVKLDFLGAKMNLGNLVRNHD